MSGTLRLRGATSGYSELQAPAVAADQTFVLPTTGGTLLTTDSPAPRLTLELGSASQPSLTFEGDTDTGLYSSGTNTLNLVTGGNERMRIDSSGRLLVGTSTSLDTGGLFQVNSDTSGIINYYEGDNATPVRFRLTKSRGETTAASDDDGLGEITFRGRATGNSLRTAALISSEVDGTPGTTSVPGRLVLATTAVGAGSATERMRIDSSGRLLVGTSSSRSLGAERLVQVEGTSSTTTNISVVRNSNDTGGGALLLGKSRGTSNGSNTVVADGDTLGALLFYGADGTALNSIGAQVSAQVDGTPGASDMPGRLVFSTTADGASSPTERMRLTSTGELLVGKTSESNMNVQVFTNAIRAGSFFTGNVHDTTNSNNRTVLIHRMDPGTNQGFQFSGNFVVQSFTGNAYINVHITKLYTSDAVEVDIIHATRSLQIAQTNVRVVTADYGSARYLGIQKNGGGTGTSHINALLSSNIGSHGGVREVNNSSLGSVTEIAKLNY